MVQELSYDAWGQLRNPANQTVYTPGSAPDLFLGRGYTGHEHLLMFGLVNMNARLYDPALGRFLSPDPYVQSPLFSQNFKRYSYAMNNPLCYIDRGGEFLFIPILIGIAWGALIGAGVSAVSYTVSAAISGNWSWSNFGQSVAMGAVGGALGGGFGALGSMGALGSFGNTLGYSMLNQAAGSALTNTMFGNNMTWGSVAGMVTGGLLGSALPNFKAVNGGAFKNAVAEIGFNSGKGAVTGFASGLVQAGIDDDPKAIWQNTLGGAIGGASSTILNIALLGPAYKPHDQYYSHDREGQSTYRKGGLLLRDGQGLTWGRSLGVSNGEGQPLAGTEAHESTHMWQQNKMGWANFYGKTIASYISDFFKHGTIDYLYNTHGTLEWQADNAARYYMNHIY